MAEQNSNSTKRPVVIEVKNLYKSFNDNHVLKGVDLELRKGENLVVLGRSGTGKSVLIKILSGLLSSLSELELRELRQKIGFSFQNSALYDSMTVKQNLEFPLIRNVRHLSRKEINLRIENVLDAVGLLQSLKQMPAELSGGQRKRIGIARTLILQPEIMLYDEPTAGLDPITCIEINNLINEVKERFHTSSIVITHDLTCAKATGDRVSMLLDGHFVRTGTFEEVFAGNDERIKSFYDYNFIN